MGGGNAGKGPDVKLPGALLGSGPCLQLILFLFWQSFELQSLDNNVNTMHPGKLSYFRAVDVDPNQTGTTDLTLYYPHVSGGGNCFLHGHVIQEESVRDGRSNDRLHLHSHKLVAVQHALPNPNLNRTSVLHGMVPLSPADSHPLKGALHKAYSRRSHAMRSGAHPVKAFVSCLLWLWGGRVL